MLRLTLISQTPLETVLALDGWLMGEDVAFLEQEGEHWRQQSQYLVLDLEGVQFIDREGIALLKRWVENGVVLRGAIPFIQAVLAAHGVEQEATGFPPGPVCPRRLPDRPGSQKNRTLPFQRFL